MIVDWVRKIIGALAVLALAAAGWFSMRLARADAAYREATPESAARAVALTPLNTAYLMLDALQVEYAGGDGRALLERAAGIAPDASSLRVKLGLEAEARGDPADAEKWLLDAARVDRQYEPRWTLANFYFRQRRMDEFWKWIRSALEVSYGDRNAAFDLCWSATPDAAAILARAIPQQHAVLAAWVWYLAGKSTLPAGDSAEAALRLAKARNADDAGLLNIEMDRLLASGQRAEALEIWKDLGYTEPPGSENGPGNLILHPDFEAPRVGHGFGWRLMETQGVRFTALDTPPALRISFDGMQPEWCVLLKQFAAIRTGKRYELSWEARGESSGVAWKAGSTSAAVKAGQDWTRGAFVFTAVFTAAQDWVELDYARPLGEARLEGSVELRHVSIVMKTEEQR